MSKVKKLFRVGKAIKKLKKGKRVSRKGWNGRSMFLEIGVMSGCDVIFLRTENMYIGVWSASHVDILKKDWYVM